MRVLFYTAAIIAAAIPNLTQAVRIESLEDFDYFAQIGAELDQMLVAAPGVNKVAPTVVQAMPNMHTSPITTIM